MLEPDRTVIGAPAIELRQLAMRAQLSLRIDANSAGAAAIEKSFALPLPTIANTVASDSERQILWLGPDEWLMVCPYEALEQAKSSLEQALAGQHALVSDVSHSRVVFLLEGEHAPEVLNKGCGLDLDSRVFGPGRCAQTTLARTHMLLHQVSDKPAYHIYMHRSFSDYAFSWLQDAAQEYRL